MAEKYFGGIITRPEPYASNSFTNECSAQLDHIFNETANMNWSHLKLHAILEIIWNIVGAANNHIAHTEPWKLAKNDTEALRAVIFDIWNSLRVTAISLYPFMPSTAEAIWKQLGLKSLVNEAAQAGEDIFKWEWMPSNDISIAKGEQLFPRIEKEEKAEKRPLKKEMPKMIVPTADTLIGIEDFAKVQLKVGLVIAAERVEKSTKLIKLKVDTGEERQIVAGIGKAYSPEELVGKKIIVLANLKPAMLMGVESQGMLLAATDHEGVLSVLTLDRDIKHGAGIR
jgi:methionyl-tRNA synthetase